MGTVFVSDGVSVAYFTVVEVTFGVDAACFTVVVNFGVDAACFTVVVTFGVGVACFTVVVTFGVAAGCTFCPVFKSMCAV